MGGSFLLVLIVYYVEAKNGVEDAFSQGLNAKDEKTAAPVLVAAAAFGA